MFFGETAKDAIRRTLHTRGDHDQQVATLEEWIAHDRAEMKRVDAEQRRLLEEMRAASAAMVEHHRSAALFPARAKMLAKEIAEQQAIQDEAARCYALSRGTEDACRERLAVYAELQAEMG